MPAVFVDGLIGGRRLLFSLDALLDGLAESHGLTTREREIAGLLARGHSGRAIEERLVISNNTVKTHTRHIYKKLDVHSQQELIDLVERLARSR